MQIYFFLIVKMCKLYPSLKLLTLSVDCRLEKSMFYVAFEVNLDKSGFGSSEFLTLFKLSSLTSGFEISFSIFKKSFLDFV